MIGEFAYPLSEVGLPYVHNEFDGDDACIPCRVSVRMKWRMRCMNNRVGHIVCVLTHIGGGVRKPVSGQVHVRLDFLLNVSEDPWIS